MRLKRSISVVIATVAAALMPLAATPADASALPSTSATTAVPGIDPGGSISTAVFLDQDGRVLSRPGANAQPSVVRPNFGCTPVSGRDNPHYTAPDVSGHGYWFKGSCNNNTATVYNCLYEYFTDGTYRQQACSPHKSLRPGGGSANRTNARVRCDATNQSISWRNMVDVDVHGEVDTGEQPYNQANVNCVVNDRS